MKLTDLDKNNVAAKALKESFAVDFDISGLDRPKTLTMLKKVKGLIAETRQSPKQHRSETNPTYMKMLFMEQALSAHLKVAKTPRIVFENEEVDKSQVILAAQDMIDQLQKMMEQISEMQFKDLPALADSIKNDPNLGADKATQYQNQSATALTQLLAAVQQGKMGLEGAQGVLTGQAPMVPGVDTGAPADDMGVDVDADLELDANLPADDEEGALPPAASLGRERR